MIPYQPIGAFIRREDPDFMADAGLWEEPAKRQLTERRTVGMNVLEWCSCVEAGRTDARLCLAFLAGGTQPTNVNRAAASRPSARARSG